MYATAISRLQLQPHEVLVIEDNENGLAAARASGAHVMAVSGVADVTYGAIMANIQAATAAERAA
jgi:beta-phosphoglucomutase-like phosphatase (HAD superfamily)